MTKIIITGGNGFIGSHIVEAFCRHGHDISCLVRPSADISAINHLPVKIIHGDITDLSGLSELFKGFHHVVHNAAMVGDWGSSKSFHQVNVEGSENVLRACSVNGINDIIMTGTISAYGEEDCSIIKNETSAMNSHYPYFIHTIFPCAMNHYRDTKTLAVLRVVRFAEEHRINLTVLEPVWVYGEREFHTGFYEYVKSAQSGLLAAPGSKRNKFHVIYAGDLAEAYVRAYEQKLQGVHRLIIGNPEADLMDDIMSIFCREAGVRKPRNAPKWLLYPIGFILELLWSISGSRNPPLLTRARVNMFYDNIEYSTEKSRCLLGEFCCHDLEKGIGRTVQWYRDNNYL